MPCRNFKPNGLILQNFTENDGHLIHPLVLNIIESNKNMHDQ